MRFTRRTLVTALVLAALISVGAGGRQGAGAMTLYDRVPRPSSQGGPTPDSGEPDVGSTRVQRTNILTTAAPRGGSVADGDFLARKFATVRWLGWNWVIRFLGMGP